MNNITRFLILFFSISGASAQLIGDFVDVTSYGANGSDEIDDTSAFQQAVATGKSIYIPEGEFIVKDTLDLVTPFIVKGAGAGKSILRFKDLGGSKHGFNVSFGLGSYRTINSITDMTIAAEGSSGKYAINTPIGNDGEDVYIPTYSFERLKFIAKEDHNGIPDGRGSNPDLKGLYTYGWSRYLSIGDGSLHTIRDVEIFGTYNYTSQSSSSQVGIFFGGVLGEGGIKAPIVDHVFITYVGTAIEFDAQVSNPHITNSQFHRVYNGIHAAPESQSGYRVLEAQLSTLNINAQYKGISLSSTAFLDINNVRLSRAANGNDTDGDWIGVELDSVDDFKLVAVRAYNTSTEYTGNHTGLLIANSSDRGYVSGFITKGELDTGIKINNSRTIAIVGAAFAGNQNFSETSFSFEGLATKDIAIIGDGHEGGVDEKYSYDSLVNKTEINIYGNPGSYTNGVANLLQGISSSTTINYEVGEDDQFHRLQFNTGSGIYTTDLKFLNQNASEGDFFGFNIKITNLNPTVRFLDNNNAVQLTLNGASTAKSYYVEMIYTGAAWRVFKAFDAL